MTGEEEKGQEHKVELRERIRLSNELGLTLSRAVQATASTATQVLQTYGDALEPAQVRRLREIERAPAAIAEVSAEEGLEAIVGYVADLVDMQGDLLEEQRKAQRETRIVAFVGWAIAIIAPFVLWWRGR